MRTDILKHLFNRLVHLTSHQERIHQNVKMMQEWYLNLEKATRKGNYTRTHMLPLMPVSTFQQLVLLREVPEKNTSSVSLAYWAIVISSFLLNIQNSYRASLKTGQKHFFLYFASLTFWEEVAAGRKILKPWIFCIFNFRKNGLESVKICALQRWLCNEKNTVFSVTFRI